MKLGSFLVFRPVAFFIVLSLIVLMLPALLIPLWITKVHRIEKEAKEFTHHVHQGLLSRIDESAKLLSQLNQSAANLQTILRSSMLNHTDISFSSIQSEVAPILFKALSTIPYISQISYITLDGLYFLFYMKDNQAFAVYSNNSTPLFMNSTANYTFYTQPVYEDSGKLYGEAIKTSVSSLIITRCFKEAMKSKSVHTYSETGWGSNQEPVLVNTVAIDGTRALSVGFQVKPLMEFLTAGLSAFDGSLYLALKDGTMPSSDIPIGHTLPTQEAGSFQLLSLQDDLVGNISCQRGKVVEVENKQLILYCSPLDLVGLQTVYVLAVPFEGLDTFINKNIKFASIYLIMTMATVVVILLAFAFITIGCARREMHLCDALIKQMEATRQAERKSMNKSAALSSASHDIRTSLAGIIGLLGICHEEVAPISDIKMNVMQAETCANDLLGILNSILDASKIEAGKMQVEEEEFDLEQLLEDTVDLFHPIGMKKRVDVLLEPYDFTFRKCSRVKGDRGKLKQILCNLLSNAVKFTSEGHVSVKVIAQKPSFPNVILTPRRNKPAKCVSCFILPSEGSYSDFEVKSNFHYDEDLIEFIFEVNDTGKGIPNEKHESVFENYIQVRDIAIGQEGTGLGLGIVQSLVRLMGGEIAIVDKEIGEKGTCFRFNTFLTICGNEGRALFREDDIEPRTHFRSPKPEGSHVILFGIGDARSRMLQKYMESNGVKAYVVNHHEQLPQTLKMIKANLVFSGKSCTRISDTSSISPRNARRTKSLPTRTFILIVIDTSAGPFREISRAVAEFRRNLTNTWVRVAWIDRPGAHSLNVQGLDAGKLPLTDVIFSKPLHGSRLYQLIGLLPEFGVTMLPHRAIQEFASCKAHSPVGSRYHSSENIVSTKDKNKPLDGKKILLAEDNAVLRKLATRVVSRLGAEIYPCQNGEEAIELVWKHLNDQIKKGTHQIMPFDYILMDCEMPIIDGYEATKRIREEEKQFGLHIPIIALTAHTSNEERNKMTEAGMNYYLSKPLKEEKLLHVVSQF